MEFWAEFSILSHNDVLHFLITSFYGVCGFCKDLRYLRGSDVLLVLNLRTASDDWFPERNEVRLRAISKPKSSHVLKFCNQARYHYTIAVSCYSELTSTII